jgi:predicted nuclease with TOPRIM domain
MINESTIVQMVERLEYFTKLARGGFKCLDKRMLCDTESMTYDVRNDLDKNQYDFEGLVSKEEYDELQKENDRLYDQVSDLEDQLDELGDDD